MKALVAFLIGAALIIFFMFFMKYYFGDPYRLFFYTVEVSNKSFESVVEDLKSKLDKNNLKVIRTLPLSKALEARGVKDFMKYTIVLACNIPQMEKLITKVPSLSNLIPCSVAVYELNGVVKMTTLKEIVFLAEEKDKLTSEEIQLVVDTYRNLRKTLDEVRR